MKNTLATDPQDEILPLVNEEGDVIGKTTRREAHANPMLIHPVVGIFVFNPQGEMLIHKRSATKDFDPNCWTLSVGGHVQYGDTPEGAVVREAEEEIGLTIAPARLQCLGTRLIRDARESEYWHGYRYDMSEEVPLTPHAYEVTELRFVSLSELRRLIDAEDIKWSKVAKELIIDFILKTI